MLKLLKPKKKSILGIDVSSTSVKILEISGEAPNYQLNAYASELLPEKAVEANVIKDVDAVAGCIKRATSRAKFSTKLAAAAVPDSAVINKVIQINEGLNDEEMEELVVMEADKYIPYPIDEINIDFEILGPSAKNSTMLDVLIVASRAENVSNRAEVLTQAGLEAKIVDVESYAVERAVQLIAPDLPAEGVDKVIAVIDVGANYTHLFVLHGMKTVFSREEEFGARLLIESLAQRYEMTYEQALEAYMQNQLLEDYKETVLEPFQEMMLLQVKRTLQFFYSTSNHGFVDHILLAGGLARQEGLVDLIQQQLGVPTTIANPFKHMQLGKMLNSEVLNKEAPALLVACGLALRSIE
ncbi:pilus assembly protein PilM [Legionella israelensis]|uniref:Pilus assembly protein PilM n=1 Tax=Legionella israelensis TaxID=454 RepID=A0A0W0VUE9_9GAMM|nr:type IV pilus assembly protein PilM [Legionella israelensis]KTD23724.1 Tfp pilus assembly protein, ATPase PilM [Legionella israelensis]QBR84010.1 pilus assembly protein PilM [Legionella israelensis]QBS10896.1 pilus assembly protein PilM [Legionella israelensis]SCX80275.1 type IV pilus assembly protein PilM [Legionella israelensis DSM 19235]STX57883.1 type IV pilus assembly protein PilM [Legionella israelensis]